MIVLEGPWKEGYAFDFHSKSSKYLGEDESGKPRFQTERTPMGEAVYRLKYWQEISQIKTIISLLTSNTNFCTLMANVDEILIVPPSNIGRMLQPVVCVAKEIADFFRKPLNTQALLTSNREQIKNLDEHEREMVMKHAAIINPRTLDTGKSYIILDDVYDTGSTLKAYSSQLQNYSINNIFVFTLTKVRSR